MANKNKIPEKYKTMTIGKNMRDGFSIGLQGALELWDGQSFMIFFRAGGEKFMETGKVPLYWLRLLRTKPKFKNFLDGYL